MAWRLITEKRGETVETPKHFVDETVAWVVSYEEIPVLYVLSELLTLRHFTPEELQEIHKAKLAYPGQRIIQEGPEV